MTRLAFLGAMLLLSLAAPTWAAAPAVERDVLALGGAVTETVFALGAGDRLVGVDLTSSYPPQAGRLPKVGYVRALGAEGLLSLMPSLVLASADAGPPEALARLEQAGVALVRLDETRTPEGSLQRVRAIGQALHRDAASQRLASAMARDLAQLQADLAAVKDQPRVLFLLSVGRGAPMAAGDDTAANAMIALAGGVNAVGDMRLYRPLSAESMLLAAPDIIVTTTDTLDGVGGVAGLRALPGLADTPAMRGGRVRAFDALYLLGFGPRLAPALHDLAAALHPQARLRDVAMVAGEP